MIATKTSNLNDLASLKIRVSEQEKIIAEKDQRILLLEELVRLHNQKRFGASSEKSPHQQEMFNEAELTDAVEEALNDENDTDNEPESPNPKAQKTGRKPLPSELPRVRVEHTISADELICDCGCQRIEIGEETSEQLDIIPATVQVLVHVRKKYACKQCEGNLKTAVLTPQPIPKSNASPGTLAHIAISKFQDALPLYRQEMMLNRSGIDMPRNTLANWVIKCGELIQPLVTLMEEHLLNYPILHCDETPVQVLTEPGKAPTTQSYMWVRVGGPLTQPVRLFDYSDTRSGEFARSLLGEFHERHVQCYLHTDDYAGYNAVCSEKSITQLGCWAHVRRKFVDAQKANNIKKTSKNKSKNKGSSKADVAINLIGKLYALEKKIKDLSTEERFAQRQEHANPLLKQIRSWLDKTLHNTLPKGVLGKALSYLDKNWEKLTVYVNDGRLNIDNNPSENAIRPFVVGRKNWLFSATVPGAKASANLYSVIETAKANGLELYRYLKKIFTELPQATTVEAIEQLLPWNVNMQDGVD